MQSRCKIVITVCYIIIPYILFFSILGAIKTSEPVYAHNGINIAIPISNQSANPDGNRTDREWNDAAKFNFSSARPKHEGNISIYLQNELSENTLSGAYFIPDGTPVDNAEHPDQIAFVFDVVHSWPNMTNSNFQTVVFNRNGTFEYWVSDNEQLNYSLVERATLNSNDTSRTHPPIRLKSPFSEADFDTRSDNDSWEGEFKISFKNSPKTMGFGISYEDSINSTTPNSTTAEFKSFYKNFPKETATIKNPGSWADITFPRLNLYLDNSKRFCPTVAPVYSPDKAVALCASINTPSIEEDEDDNVLKVSGALANLINGAVINDTLSIDIYNEIGFLELHKPFIPPKNGKFTETPDTKDLKSGRYRIVVQPESEQYKKLVSNQSFTVNPHALTVQEFGTFIGIAATAIGFVAFLPQIRNHFKGNRQTQNMVKEMSEINAIYDRTQERDSNIGQSLQGSLNDKEHAVHDLKRKRDNALALLGNNQISQAHFSLIDSKISEYTSKLMGNKSAPP